MFDTVLEQIVKRQANHKSTSTIVINNNSLKTLWKLASCNDEFAIRELRSLREKINKGGVKSDTDAFIVELNIQLDNGVRDFC